MMTEKFFAQIGSGFADTSVRGMHFERGDDLGFAQSLLHRYGSRALALDVTSTSVGHSAASFVINSDLFDYFHKHDLHFPPDFGEKLRSVITLMSADVDLDKRRVLLLAVRPSLQNSIPGLLPPMFDIGISPALCEKIAPDSYFAWYRCWYFVQQFSSTILGLDPEVFEAMDDQMREQNGLSVDQRLDASMLRSLVAQATKWVADETGSQFPFDPVRQIALILREAFVAWNNHRAVTYRMLHGIDNTGLAFVLEETSLPLCSTLSCRGHILTRNDFSGEKEISGSCMLEHGPPGGDDDKERLDWINSSEPTADGNLVPDRKSITTTFPAQSEILSSIADKLDKVFAKALDISFSLVDDRVIVHDVRAARNSVSAKIQIATEMVNAGVLTKREAVLTIDPASLEELIHYKLDASVHDFPITTGAPASPGAVSGEIVMSALEARIALSAGRSVIFVREETTPEDVYVMRSAGGIVTVRGGINSHAAVVARGMGKPCVAGVKDMKIEQATGRVICNGRVIERGEVITIDGGSGNVYIGELSLVAPSPTDQYGTFMQWADEFRRVSVRVNAEIKRDVKLAIGFGAEGIGLCRTEHMFFERGRINVMRRLVLADYEEERRAALEQLLPMQRADFVELFEVMAGKPITLRLLDVPLHEFIPKKDDDLVATALALEVDPVVLRNRAEQLTEMNPMLGHRGCRLAVSYPEIVEMQTRAILLAVQDVYKAHGIKIVPEIMVPMVSSLHEFDFVRRSIDKAAASMIEQDDCELDYLVGVMIELPRAALRAKEIARSADFFSFGTNDLTQMIFGLSRDDATKFMGDYLRHSIMPVDPFKRIDEPGVGALIAQAVQGGRSSQPELVIGVCGEHGGDPQSIGFFDNLGVDYVSCSPYRVAIARLAGAQSAILREAAAKE